MLRWPLTRSVEEAALVYQVLQGVDLRDATTVGVMSHDALQDLKGGVKGLRVVFGETVFFDGVDPEVEKAVRGTGKAFELWAPTSNASRCPRPPRPGRCAYNPTNPYQAASTLAAMTERYPSWLSDASSARANSTGVLTVKPCPPTASAIRSNLTGLMSTPRGV